MKHATNVNPGRCLLCNEEGHWARECPPQEETSCEEEAWKEEEEEGNHDQ